MGRPKKIVDFSEPRSTGDNSEEALRDFVSRYANLQNQIVDLRGDQKEILTEAKDCGHSKMAIRKAVKILQMSEEQVQAHKEIDDQVQRITEACADLPLFQAA